MPACSSGDNPTGPLSDIVLLVLPSHGVHTLPNVIRQSVFGESSLGVYERCLGFVALAAVILFRGCSITSLPVFTTISRSK